METSSGATRIALAARAAAALFCACAIATACGSSNTAPDVAATEAPPGGDDAGAPSLPGCPQIAPDEGALCSSPEGTTCDFGACSTRIARCSRGRWVYGNNPLPEPTCPTMPPEEGAACPPCWQPSATCMYGSVDCSSPDASANTAVASCAGGVWSVTVRPCREGGADVQDAGEDADLSDDAEADAD